MRSLPSLVSSWRRAALLAPLLIFSFGCESPEAPPQGGEDAAMMSPVDGGDPGPKTCASCKADEVCVDGSCVVLPKTCPCPSESYCNLGTNMCVVGCLDDTNCAKGRICDSASRKCQDGCRSDGACGSGKICDANLCRTGCRKDMDCGANQYCDSTKQVCMPGCKQDTECMSRQICDNLRCRSGCRMDSGCTSGQICESTMCKAGCRNDSGCMSGQICESLKCRAGCRNDMDCGMESVCKTSSLTCVKCGTDADEATDSSVSTSGRSVSERKVRVLCGKSDVDQVTWRQGPPNPGYYRYSVWATTTGASAGAKTNIKYDFGFGTMMNFTIVGNTTQTLASSSYDYYCYMGMCGGWTHNITADSDSETPVTIEFGFSVSATR